ncbi:hypothetical protein DYB32_007475 [Aphanomyces invadans]|uniref:Uncharacterized protein n=1 Tax=Aphanomyces invadans TaxID=157072 RepID=A0A3R6YV57_9STRA|nr:hypothetical protein DYB32_007475 [Aphanomyces invadans]
MEDEYVWVQPLREWDVDEDVEGRCLDLQCQVRELQAAQMRWEIHRMDLEMQLMTERSARHHELQLVEDQLHHERQVVMLLAHERAMQTALITDLRAQLHRTRHKRKMTCLKKELREKYLAIRMQRSVAMATRCDGNASLLDLLKREVPKMQKEDSADPFI